MWFSLQLNLTAGEEVEIDYEVDGWFHVSIHSGQQNKKPIILTSPYIEIAV